MENRFVYADDLETNVGSELRCNIEKSLANWMRRNQTYTTHWVAGVASMVLSKGIEVRSKPAAELVKLMNDTIDEFYEDYYEVRLANRWTPVVRSIILAGIFDATTHERLRRQVQKNK